MESEANWSDGSSREFAKCGWAKTQGFRIDEIPAPDVFAQDIEDIVPQLWSVIGIGEVAAAALGNIESALGVLRGPLRQLAVRQGGPSSFAGSAIHDDHVRSP